MAPFVVDALMISEKYVSEDDWQTSLFLKIAFFRFVNTAIVAWVSHSRDRGVVAKRHCDTHTLCLFYRLDNPDNNAFDVESQRGRGGRASEHLSHSSLRTHCDPARPSYGFSWQFSETFLSPTCNNATRDE